MSYYVHATCFVRVCFCQQGRSLHNLSRSSQDGSQTTAYPQMRTIIESVHEAQPIVLTELIITLN